MIVNFKTRFRVETYDCRLIVHMASIMIEKPRFISCITGFNKNPRIVNEKPCFADLKPRIVIYYPRFLA